jgi:hypothetical protein
MVYQRALGTGLLDGLIVAADKLHDPLVPQIIAGRFPPSMWPPTRCQPDQFCRC